MDTDTATKIIGNVGPDTNEDEYLTAFQTLIDTGRLWALDNFYHRQAVDLIGSGRIQDTYNVMGCNPHAK